MIINVAFERIVDGKMEENYTWSGNQRQIGEDDFVNRDEMIERRTGRKYDGIQVSEEKMFEQLNSAIPKSLDYDTQVYVNVWIVKQLEPTVFDDIKHFTEHLDFNGIYALEVRII